MLVKVTQPITQPSGKVWPVGSIHEVAWDKATEFIELGVAEHYIGNPVLQGIQDRRSKEKKETRNK